MNSINFCGPIPITFDLFNYSHNYLDIFFYEW